MKFYISCLLPLSLFSADFFFAHPEYPWHVFGNYVQVGKADFKKEDAPGSHVTYSEAAASLYYTQFINSDNFLTFELGNAFIQFDWDENPRFKQKSYYTTVGSLALVTTAKEGWRWVINPGVAVDTTTFNFGNTGVYYGLLWGRYAYLNNLGLHIGAFGYYGVKNGLLLPVLGVDWHFKTDWRLNLIFPLNGSLEYQISPSWVALLAIDGFNSPYRFPRRAHQGCPGFENGIFEIFSTGLEAAINYAPNRLKIEAGVGWNFGGWIYIKESNNHNGKYFDYEGAPYGQINLSYTF